MRATHHESVAVHAGARSGTGALTELERHLLARLGGPGPLRHPRFHAGVCFVVPIFVCKLATWNERPVTSSGE